MEQMRIVKEMRDECRKTNQPIRPRFLVWENVFGAFSSGNPGGSDFQAVLEEICKIVKHDCPVVPIPKEGWPASGNLDGVGDDGTPFSISWRVHDAQYWGVPQRRRRIALVADFGGTSAPEILFEREGMSGNSEQSISEREETPGTAPDSTGEPSGSEQVKAIYNHPQGSELSFIEEDVSQTLTARAGTGGNNTPMVFENHSQDTRYTPLGDVCQTVSATYGMGGNNQPLVVDNPTIAIEGNGTRDSHKGDGYSESDVMYTLNTVEQHAVAYGIDQQGGKGQANCTTDVAPTLAADSHGTPHAVAYGFHGQAGASTGMPVVEEGTPTMVANQVTNVVQTAEPILLESNQNHATIQTDGISTALPASMGEGGGYVPMVVDEQRIEIKQEGCDLYNLAMTGEVSATLSTLSGTPDGSGGKVLMTNVPAYAVEPGAASRLGGHVTKEVAPTLRAEMGDNQTAVVYGMSSYDSNAMKSDNPNSGIYKADTARTLDLNGGNPACNQGGMMVVQDSTLSDTEKAQVEDWVDAVNSSAKHQQDHIQSDLGVASTLAPGTHASGPHLTKTLVTSSNAQEEPLCVQRRFSAVNVYEDGVTPTLEAGAGEGGNNMPLVVENNQPETTAFSQNEREEVRNLGDVAGALSSEPGTHQQTFVAQTFKKDSQTNSTEDTNCLNPWDYQTNRVMSENGVAATISRGSDISGNVTQSVLQTIPQTCQKTTGALMASGYSKLGTQEATNDMYVVQDPSAFITSESEDSVEPKVQSMEVFHCTSEENLAAPLKARDYKDPQVVAFEPGAASRVGGHVYTDDKAGTLRAEMGDNQQAICQGFDSYNGTVYPIDQGAGKSGCNFDVNKAPTLTTTHGGEPVVLNDQGGQQMDVTQGAMATLRAEAHEHEPIVFDPSRRHDCEPFGDVCETVQAAYGTGGNNVPFVLNPEQQSNEDSSVVFENHSQDTRYNELGEVCQTVSATWGMGGNNQPLEVKPQQAIVRRLTPLECERLQGFPDYWTHIGDWVDSSGKKHKDSDSPKYKALGNSIALPYWYWMAGNMVDQLKKSGISNPTMASLFDGIAGFPYVYIRHGCMPLWTSEIEEFPIAVCKKHFGDEDTGEVGDIEEYLKLPVNWVTSNTTIEHPANSPIAFDRATFNQGANAKYDFSITEDVAQTLVSRGPGICQ